MLYFRTEMLQLTSLTDVISYGFFNLKKSPRKPYLDFSQSSYDIDSMNAKNRKCVCVCVRARACTHTPTHALVHSHVRAKLFF